MKKKSLARISTCLIALTCYAQTYSIVIKNGHVIDPKNNINEIMDIAINGEKTGNP